MNGSDTLSVIGLSIHEGSGAFSQCRMCPWKAKATMTADEDGAEHDEEAVTKLVEMLDERCLLAVARGGAGPAASRYGVES